MFFKTTRNDLESKRALRLRLISLEGRNPLQGVGHGENVEQEKKLRPPICASIKNSAPLERAGGCTSGGVKLASKRNNSHFLPLTEIGEELGRKTDSPTPIEKRNHSLRNKGRPGLEMTTGTVNLLLEENIVSCKGT